MMALGSSLLVVASGDVCPYQVSTDMLNMSPYHVSTDMVNINMCPRAHNRNVQVKFSDLYK